MAGQPQLITPFRYTIIEDGLFRGSYPTPRNHRFLKRLKLKTIVSLIPDPPTKELSDFCKANQIQNIHFPVKKYKEDVVFSANTVTQIIHILITPHYFPMYVHCLDGANNTGLVIMCLRKLQNWTLSFIFAEFVRFTRDSHISSSESEFVENFREEILIPVTTPKWLWAGEKINDHPTLNIKFQTSDSDKVPKKKDTNKKRIEHEHWKEKKVHASGSSSSRNLLALDLDIRTPENVQ